MVRDDMGKLNVKDGTPVGSQHLCKSCSWCQYTTGYRESDVIVICCNVSPNLRVPFPVHDCSDYADKHKPSYDQMTKLAIEVRPSRVLRATPGFATTDVCRKVAAEVEDEEEDEAVACSR